MLQFLIFSRRKTASGWGRVSLGYIKMYVLQGRDKLWSHEVELGLGTAGRTKERCCEIKKAGVAGS